MKVYQARVESTPTRESELIELTRDYDTLQKTYTSLLGKKEDSKIAANLERRQIGEQFKILDPARMPERPFSPDRSADQSDGRVVRSGAWRRPGGAARISRHDASRPTTMSSRRSALPVLAVVPDDGHDARRLGAPPKAACRTGQRRVVGCRAAAGRGVASSGSSRRRLTNHVRTVLRPSRAAIRSDAEPAVPVSSPRKHREALSNLQYGISARRGVTLLIGEAGTGKTTLVRAALELEQRENTQCVYLNNPALTRAEFIEFLARAFGLSERAAQSKTALLLELEVLLRERRAAGIVRPFWWTKRRAFLCELLEEIRLLANIETTTEKLLPVVLAGQPELSDKSERP